MKILWVTNVPLPEICDLLNIKNNPLGGWLVQSSDLLARTEQIDLNIAFPFNKDIDNVKGEKVNYHAFCKLTESKVTNLIESISPDVIHIYGTELPHSFLFQKCAEALNIKVVVSIQGLVSVCSKYIYADLPLSIIYGMTFRNLLKFDNVFGLKRLFDKRGRMEVQLLQKSQAVIGRTQWDKECVSHINPDLTYYHCNETIREIFYHHKWNINKISKHQIFISQGHYPLKGLHYLIEAISNVVKVYPETKVIIGGKNILKDDSRFGIQLKTKYANYINGLINKYELENNINFLGTLDQEQMVENLLKSHLYVCCSTIENSPNSLGEAMLIGVPSIASFVGGIPDMVNDGDNCLLYQHNAPYMLANKIKKIFGSDDLALKLSKKAIEKALVTHAPQSNNKNLIDIYKKIFKGDMK
ncbi:glycosyltransferase [Colwellia sp. BRX10-6]|uniref:glycosyltransferase family 4 protein n=1 Tax=unclassified Colwellia TaxID=196834 RepID=UPI0015F64350|nr:MULTISPECIES: glycosyltransferase [unclassified Colwellia]MBA6384477.1 glycosyltransferase [Colwellia sp. BRX10-9]MBA6396037.1 glycosyltransferase [Colwellia sp. BRX10-6]